LLIKLNVNGIHLIDAVPSSATILLAELELSVQFHLNASGLLVSGGTGQIIITGDGPTQTAVLLQYTFATQTNEQF
jgi:hypothetical protein